MPKNLCSCIDNAPNFLLFNDSHHARKLLTFAMTAFIVSVE